jgi:hypothetical protein
MPPSIFFAAFTARKKIERREGKMEGRLEEERGREDSQEGCVNGREGG